MIGLPFPIHMLERWAHTCPLVLCFVDAATGAPVRDSLTAITWAGTAATRRRDTRLITAAVNRSGIYFFHDLPGLQEFEHATEDDRWQRLAPAAQRAFPIEVGDAQQRYLPCTFVVSAPHEGPVSLADGGSPTWVEPGTIPLFSSVTRPTPPGAAVIRAELYHEASGAAAAWALAEISFESQGATQVVRGLTDDQGRLVVAFAYPEGPRRVTGGSPPADSRGLAREEWSVTAAFFHDPVGRVEESADYSRRLSQPACIARRAGSPPQPVAQATLEFGTDLNLGRLALSPA